MSHGSVATQLLCKNTAGLLFMTVVLREWTACFKKEPPFDIWW